MESSTGSIGDILPLRLNDEYLEVHFVAVLKLHILTILIVYDTVHNFLKILYKNLDTPCISSQWMSSQ